MLCLMMCLCLLDNDQSWKIAETGIFQPLKRHEVMVRSDGQVYIRNFYEQRLQHYNADGEHIRDIGRKGKGPGEFTFPTYSQLAADRIFVNDMLEGSISEFDLNGKFIQKFRAPGRNMDMVRVKGGWIFGTWGDFAFEQNGQTGLSWADPTFAKTKELLAIKNPGNGQGMMVWQNGSDVKATFSPINNQPKLLVNADGTQVFLTDSDEFKIIVVDHTGKLIRTIQRNDKRLPFDVEWAEENFRERMERQREKPTYKIDKLYPEFFPAIRDLMIDPDGILVVDRWRGRPDGNHHPIAIDMEGNETKTRFSWEALERLMGVHNGYGYIAYYNSENEEAGLAKMPLDEIDAFVKANPIKYEGPTGYSISISD